MLGAIIGDIVGSAYEFNPTNDYNFELFPAEADFTDDTICTIAVADALLRQRPFGESLHEWCRRYPYPKGGYGGRFAQWVMSNNPQPYGSFGNGSAMRVSPIGWWTNDQRELLCLAKQSAECTHNHPFGIKGAEAIAMAIMDCRLNFKSGKYAATPANILRYGIHNALQLLGYEERFELNLEEYRNRFDETCQGTVPVALYIVMTSQSFEDALRRAVSLGGDADTLGAIVGSIAEPIWGIPTWLKQRALTYLPPRHAQSPPHLPHPTCANIIYFSGGISGGGRGGGRGRRVRGTGGGGRDRRRRASRDRRGCSRGLR